ncbi:MmcQ/YjbR family DNA-binding protein [Shouchella patagoniensis]|uniref:MmcQ/YjbR family DNA-binding protein n=1 Tax=Shouchella patagoniensis TaxID=228576 RepID=UPI0009949DA3|nr:MmcQ/YjbR family DNA-binding protein [Shouchella patagoniensis]
MDELELIQKRMKAFEKHGNSLVGAKVYYRGDWDAYYFDIAGKQFGIMSPKPSKEALITLKNLPEKNEELREMYEDVIPGYYANKNHWNSIMLHTSELSDEEIQLFITVSYELVLKKFPLKERKRISELSTVSGENEDN